MSTLTGPKQARVLRKRGAILVLDLEALRNVKGVFETSVRKK